MTLGFVNGVIRKTPAFVILCPNGRLMFPLNAKHSKQKSKHNP